MKKTTKKNKVGSILVVGAGIGGMQCALDLAESGFKVYLLDSASGIGGSMAKLDKTFPTNDCAMCVMSPKLVECGRHLNIEIITLADLQSIEGDAGNFKVTLVHHPRYIDIEKCTGCGECAEICNVEVPNEFDAELGKRKAVYRLYPQAIPNTFAIHKIGIPPCRHSCPTGVNIQGYIALIRQKKYAEALALFKEKNPFPGICGRICHYPCEVECNRGKELDEPIASRSLHRFLADLEMKGIISAKKEGDKTAEKEEVKNRPKGAKVAIVGSGPAGLTTAYDLANMGYKPTIFEALPVTGGMLRVGIPRYRLPEDVIDFEIEAIKRAGVEIKTNTPVGPDLTLKDLLKQMYKAIFIAIGTHKSRRLNIEGEDFEGVVHGVGFLRNVKIGKKKERLDGKLVAVVGGGNVALDSVRTALRLGAKKAFVIYRRSKKEMPVFETELEAGEQEGVEIHYLVSPKRILGEDGKVVGIECIKMKLGEPDHSGRRRPIPIEGSEFILETDVVIPAVSQTADLSFLTEVSGIKVTKDGVLAVEGIDLEGVYGFTDILREASLGHKVDIGSKVIVIGGGNAAVDVARTALRLGSREIHLVCLEKRHEMPAFKNEVDEAEKEGIIIHNSLAPLRIISKNDKATGVKFVKCVSVFDSEGNFNPRFKSGMERTIKSETIIVAIGQVADYSLLRAADGALVTRANYLEVDDITYATNMKGVFAGGDVIGGPGLALSAIADGHEAAISIDRFLRGEDLKAGRVKKEPVEISGTPEEEFELRPREVMSTLPVEKRIRNFKEVELGFTEEQALIEANRCLNCSICAECMQCVEVCEAKAIDHKMGEKRTQLNVGSVVLAPGFELFNAKLRGEYGFGRYSNVITHLQLERMLSATGPSKGEVFRPSDHKPAKRIAFIQCVGSRDEPRGNEYCSAICCMSSTKEAIIAKEHNPDVDITIFYLDIRTFGKGFERYYQNAKDEHGIKYEHCMISKITELQQSKMLRLRYAKDNSLQEDEFDLVVLACALNSSEKTRALANDLALKVNEYGFCQTDEFFTNITSRSGVFTAGVFNGPKDIPETVVEASSAAAEASRLLAPVRGTMVKKKEYPPESDVEGVPLRIGVFVCRCGHNIAGVVDVPAVVESAKTLQDVVFADENLFTCSQDSLENIKKIVEEHKLNRVVVASCTPVTHAPIFRDTIKEVGLNPYLFELVSIREHCSWVHMNDHDGATEKAKQLVAMGVAKVRFFKPIKLSLFDVDRKVLIIGGGLSGMTAAVNLAEQNFEVHLIEKEDNLGGNLRNLYSTLQRKDVQELFKNMSDRVQSNKHIHVLTNTHVQETSGYLGNYKTKVFNEKEEKFLELQHGAIIVATGAQEYKPTEYLYGQDERIITQRELEEKLVNNQLPITNYQSVVMIQCVGSRSEEHDYCSRVCCSHAIKNALKIKELNPETNVYVLYRDVRTYGLLERYYREARDKGVIFIRYDEKQKPEVSKNEGLLQVTLPDFILNEDIILKPDLLVLSTGIVPNNEGLARTLKLPLTPDGFFLEAHAKIRPVDFSVQGIFLCGLAHSPRAIRESIIQAQAAAIKVVELLSKEKLEAKAEIPEIKEKWCSGCGLCVEVCQYNARELDKEKRVSNILEAICQGCGACAAVCPNGATQQREFESKEIFSMIDVVAGD